MSAPYRSDAEALRARLALLEEQLATVKVRRAELTELQQMEAGLESEIDSLRRKLEGMPRRKSLRLLEDVRVASPCHMSWDAMRGNGRARFCTSCQKDVYNLSGMSRAEAEGFLAERTGDVCVRLHRRHDGTVLTTDCPVGRRKRVRKLRAVAAFSALVVTALAARGFLSFDRAASTLRRLGIDVARIDTDQNNVMGMMVADPIPANATSAETPSAIRTMKVRANLLDAANGEVVVGSVPANELVIVRREVGEWVLVTYVDPVGNVGVTGWTWRSLVQ